MRGREKMYILVTYIPPSHLEAVKEALFAAGAGTIASYDRCCFQLLGEGQFRPLEGSTPYIGEQGGLTRQEEWRLELTVEEAVAEAVVEALLASHPYQVPAYHLIPVLTIEELKERSWQRQ